MSNSNSSSSGIEFPGLLTIVFITLKLCKVIAWSWWWVLSPVWITSGIALLVLIIYGLLLGRKSVDEKKRLASGMNKWAWDNRKKKVIPKEPEPVFKSKWQERVAKMQNRNSLGKQGKGEN